MENFFPHCGFSPTDTFESGQCFRWEPCADGYRGVVGGRLLNVRREGDGLRVGGLPENGSAKEWARYFGLDMDYNAICAELSALDPVLADACARTPGLRLLRQEPWEALCSFLISQNNNIPRIKGIISRFCTLFGQPVAEGFFAFPTAERIASAAPEELEALRCGYRAGYLLDAARRVADGKLRLAEVAALPLPEARQQLREVRGVGPKVAECVLLYGMARWDAFPEDVWIKRVMTLRFPGRSADFFGRYAGIAQQFLFCAIRGDRPPK